MILLCAAEHDKEKKPITAIVQPLANTSVDTRSVKKGNATITTTRTTVTVTTNQQQFVPASSVMSTKRQLFPVQGSDQSSSAAADCFEQVPFTATAAPVKSCSGIVFSSSVTVTTTQSTTTVAPITSIATSKPRFYTSTQSIPTTSVLRKSYPIPVTKKFVSQVPEKGKGLKNSTNTVEKNITTTSSAPVVKHPTTSKANSTIAQHSGSAPKKKSLYSSAVVGSQTHVSHSVLWIGVFVCIACKLYCLIKIHIFNRHLQ